MPLINLVVWFLIIIILSFVLDLFLKRVFSGGRYLLIIAPGVIIHELSHAFACLLMFAKVKEIKFFDKKGGFVKHEKSRFPIIGQVIISLAPLFVGIGLIFILARLLSIDPNFHLDLSWSRTNLNLIIEAISKIDYFNFQNLLIIYLLFSISVTMTPSFIDLVNSFLGLLFVGGLLWLIDYYFVINLPETFLSIALSLVVLTLIIGIIFSMILCVIKSIFL
jgi:hypothetical protein